MARSLLGELSPDFIKGTRLNPAAPKSQSKSYEEGGQKIVEGTFDGMQMLGPDGKNFPVPANYASKSKLVEGDRLKLTILPNGSFLYKQIAPAPRKFIKGTLIQEDGEYKVATDTGVYKVILASVTYYKGQVGDDVTLIVPDGPSAIWGAIEAILPSSSAAADEKEMF